jgi:hypothetical protein
MIIAPIRVARPAAAGNVRPASTTELLLAGGLTIIAAHAIPGIARIPAAVR